MCEIHTLPTKADWTVSWGNTRSRNGDQAERRAISGSLRRLCWIMEFQKPSWLNACRELNRLHYCNCRYTSCVVIKVTNGDCIVHVRSEILHYHRRCEHYYLWDHGGWIFEHRAWLSYESLRCWGRQQWGPEVSEWYEFTKSGHLSERDCQERIRRQASHDDGMVIGNSDGRFITCYLFRIGRDCDLLERESETCMTLMSDDVVQYGDVASELMSTTATSSLSLSNLVSKFS